MQSTQKVAIVTGASRGIRASLVRGFREIGYCVVANSRSIVASDVVGAAIERFERIDTLVNNAGVFIPRPFVEYTEANFTTMIAVNLAGFFHISQRAASQMLRAGSGHIVTITAALADQPIAAVSAALTSLTKGGLNALTRALAIESAGQRARSCTLTAARMLAAGDRLPVAIRSKGDRHSAQTAVLSFCGCSCRSSCNGASDLRRSSRCNGV